MAGQILTSARVQEAEEWSEGRVGEGEAYIGREKEFR